MTAERSDWYAGIGAVWLLPLPISCLLTDQNDRRCSGLSSHYAYEPHNRRPAFSLIFWHRSCTVCARNVAQRESGRPVVYLDWRSKTHAQTIG